jgi:putative flippase GtrA
MTAIIKKYLNRETVSYLICGVLATIVGLGTYALAIYVGLNTATANTVSTVLAVLFAYATNKVFVFRSPGWGLKKIAPELGKFCAARLLTFVVETLLLVLLVDMMGLHSMITKGGTMVLVIIGNYVLSKWIVFTDKSSPS